MFVTHPAFLREKALHLRVERRLTIDEIAERLLVPRGTIYHWVRDLPALERKGRGSPGQRKGNRAMQRKYARLREEAYEEGLAMYPALIEEPLFRDFLCMYVGEGLKRSRHRVALGNSNPSVVKLAQHWMLRFSRNPLHYAIQYHADQDLDELRSFWADVLDIDGAAIRMQRKSNSGKLTGRTWRSAHGVMSVEAGDTYFRARLQAWLDQLQAEWLSSVARGVAQPGSAFVLGTKGQRFESARPDSAGTVAGPAPVAQLDRAAAF